MRTLILLIACAVLLYALASAQERGYTLAIGRFSATEAEIIECWFTVGANTALALHPKGEPCKVAKELIGKTGTLVFVPNP